VATNFAIWILFHEVIYLEVTLIIARKKTSEGSHQF